MMVRNMIIKYKECININKDFKSSINLLYDLNNYDKINNFFQLEIYVMLLKVTYHVY